MKSLVKWSILGLVVASLLITVFVGPGRIYGLLNARQLDGQVIQLQPLEPDDEGDIETYLIEIHCDEAEAYVFASSDNQWLMIKKNDWVRVRLYPAPPWSGHHGQWQNAGLAAKLVPPKPEIVKPAKPVPAKPAPAKPAPAKPVPAKPAPAKPAPAKPAPAKPVPAKPVPAKPSPAKPAPVKPSAPKPEQPNPAPVNSTSANVKPVAPNQKTQAEATPVTDDNKLPQSKNTKTQTVRGQHRKLPRGIWRRR